MRKKKLAVLLIMSLVYTAIPQTSLIPNSIIIADAHGGVPILTAGIKTIIIKVVWDITTIIAVVILHTCILMAHVHIVLAHRHPRHRKPRLFQKQHKSNPK